MASLLGSRHAVVRRNSHACNKMTPNGRFASSECVCAILTPEHASILPLPAEPMRSDFFQKVGRLATAGRSYPVLRGARNEEPCQRRAGAGEGGINDKRRNGGDFAVPPRPVPRRDGRRPWRRPAPGPI